MAKQTGIFPLKGSIGNVTFYKSKAGDLARQKGGVDGSRIATDPRLSVPVRMERNLAGQAKPVSCCVQRSGRCC